MFNKKPFHHTLLFVLVISILSLNSCKKDDEDDVDNQTTSSQDNSIAQNIFQDVKKVVEEAASDEGASDTNKKAGYTFGNCATVTINPAWTDTATWPKVMTIDFGTTNCTGSYGNNRRGVLVVTLSDRYRNPGSVISVQPQDYYFNDYKIEGSKTITNNGRNAANNLSYTVQVSNGKLTYPDGSISSWESTRTNEWVAGESTTLFSDGFAGICDDEYLITGSANGVNKAGLPYSVNITSPLHKKICCRWIVAGALDIAPSGLDTRSIDFGTGACDAIRGNTFTIPLN